MINAKQTLQAEPEGWNPNLYEAATQELWQRLSGKPPLRFPLDDSQVIELFDTLDYTLDRKTLRRFIASKYLPRPSGNRWTLKDVRNLQLALEVRRYWKPLSELHDAKKSKVQQGQEIAKAVGDKDTDIDRLVALYSLEDLILLLEACDNPWVRHNLAIAARTKMGLGE